MRQVIDCFHDLPHSWLGTLIGVLQDHCKSADTLGQRRDICLATAGDIVWPEQDADITIKFGLLTLSCPAWRSILPVQGQVPSQLLCHAFFGVDMPVEGFLADALFSALIDRPITDLLGCPTVLKVFNYSVAQVRMPNEFALC